LSLRRFYSDYQSEVVFGVLLSAIVALSYFLARFIPVDVYTNGIRQILNGCIATVGLGGAGLMWRHHKGIRARKIWSMVLLTWTVLEVLLLADIISYGGTNDTTGFLRLRGWELVIGNFYAWLLLLYPTEVLRPGWLNVKRSVIHLMPVVIIAVVDYLLPVDLRVLLALYPVVLIGFLTMHIRAYRKWCEDNYSSMEDIDAQWIVRYLMMVLISGLAYAVLSFSFTPAHTFTQQWLLLFILSYSTEQILFRPDPWEVVRSKTGMREKAEPESDEAEQATETSNAAYRAQLEEWMEREKPYLQPEFRLTDLQQVLPLNRTYLSQFINTEYNCNFYQFVTNYRIEEAKRLMRANPDMQMQEVAERCGFSSPTVFSRVFSREIGKTPREWNIEIDNS